MRAGSSAAKTFSAAHDMYARHYSGAAEAAPHACEAESRIEFECVRSLACSAPIANKQVMRVAAVYSTISIIAVHGAARSFPR